MFLVWLAVSFGGVCVRLLVIWEKKFWARVDVLGYMELDF